MIAISDRKCVLTIEGSKDEIDAELDRIAPVIEGFIEQAQGRFKFSVSVEFEPTPPEAA